MNCPFIICNVNNETIIFFALCFDLAGMLFYYFQFIVFDSKIGVYKNTFSKQF